MLLTNLNPLGIYPNKTDRRWDKTANKNILVRYKTNELPPLIFIASGTITGTMQLYTCGDVASGSTLTLTPTVGVSGDGITCTVLKYVGATLTSQIDGYYYYKITLSDGLYYYTDMFEWVTTVSSLLYFKTASLKSVDSGDFILPLSNLNYNFYLDVVASGVEAEQLVESDKQYGIDNLMAGSRVFYYKYKMLVSLPIYRFLSALILLRGNGTVSCTWDSIEHFIENIACDKTEEYTDDIIVLEFKYVDRFETISMLNL